MPRHSAFAYFICRSAILVACFHVAAAGSLEADEDIRFSRDILPVLSENCFFCHGPDENNRQADLRLDTEDGARTAIGGPGLPDSLILERILSDDHDELMPPPDSNRRLTKVQKQKLKDWVAGGGKWGQHWSFEQLTLPSIPDQTFDDAPSHNAIDNFVQAKLKSKKLHPAPAAARHTLLRRVTLDLTGLPPTPAQLNRFLADKSADAYEKAVDRLFASEAYGERMAWEWLDAARYADSNGYQGDRERTMWPWRDWVVAAFNRNMPFDEFSTLQLAGDLLPDATPEQRLATGFCRNHMINGEGGRIPEENRVDYVMDMTETMGTVWLGLTLNCCRCHDHKYDPLTQNEYYQFFDFFNQTPVSGGGGDPQTAPNITTPDTSARTELNQIKAAKSDRQATLTARAKALNPHQEQWEQRVLRDGSRNTWRILKPDSYSAEHQKLNVLDDQSLLVDGTNAVNDTYTVQFTLPSSPLAAIQLDALRHPSMTKGGIARSDSGNFVLTEIQFTLIRDGQRLPIKPTAAQATFEQGPYKIGGTLDSNPQTGWAVYNGKAIDRDHAAIFQFASISEITEGARLEVVLKHDSPHKYHNLGRFRLAVSSKSDAPLEADESALLTDLQVPLSKRSKEQSSRIRAAFLNDDHQYQAIAAELGKLNAREAAINKAAPRVMIMADRTERRETFVLNRGLYNSPTMRQVASATPGFLPPMPAGGPHANRLDLAKWLFSSDHPLTARVTVNRFWQQIFGTGLVKTIEDFGVQSEYPEYGDLLDWLAADFRNHGWNVKRLMKTIVMSHTYRQSSSFHQPPSGISNLNSTSLIETDPENRLLARASRFRMSAWMLRDQALAASGLLNEQVGGRPVNTYQPAGVWEEATFGKKTYKQDVGDKLYRRSLYIFWRRIIAPTMLFDNASRQTCTVKSLRTNTPLHALLTLNETTFVESARYLAQKLLTDESLPNDTARLQQAFRRVVCRPPQEEELKIMAEGIRRSTAEYSADASAAIELLSVGESPRDESLAAATHAAWTAACLTLLNLDETLNRE